MRAGENKSSREKDLRSAHSGPPLVPFLAGWFSNVWNNNIRGPVSVFLLIASQRGHNRVHL